MRYRNLGKSGLKVSVLSLGSWLTFSKYIDDGLAAELMKHAYEQGVNFFDNAEGYNNGGSETVMGQVLQKMAWNRETFLVSSKVFFGTAGKEAKPNQTGLSRKHVFEACHAALRRFQLDYLDLFFCHRPDESTPIVETVFAMNQLLTQGKILYWGTSEWSAAQIMEAYTVARENHLVPPTMEQPQYNLFHRERVEKEYKPLYQEIGLGTTIWSPLASGMLTGKYNVKNISDRARLSTKGLEWLKEKSLTEQRLLQVEALMKLAANAGMTVGQLALAWCMKNEQVSTAITGATNMVQLKENLRSVEMLDKLDAPLMEDIHRIFP